MEVMSQRKRTTTIPKLEKYSSRPDPFKPKKLPDSNNYQTEGYNANKGSGSPCQKGLGSLTFNKRPKKEFHSPPKPFSIPEGYDQERLEKGMELLSS